MPSPFTEALATALDDPARRAELRAAAARPGRQALLTCHALATLTAIADDDYTGFEAATARIVAAPPRAWPDAAGALLAHAGALTAGAFHALDAPGLAAHAAAIAEALPDSTVPAPLRCCAALAALAYHHISMDLAAVLGLELALRPLLAGATLPPRLAGEALHLLVQALYQCEAPERALALRRRAEQNASAALPVIALKWLLLDAQMALGRADADAGRTALARAEPLLDPRAPRPAGWWHLLQSRLELLDGRQRQALVHARLALRLATQSRLPERWMGVTVMQEGQVQVAAGRPADAIPFFERAGRAASGSQARFCWSLARLARALDRFGAGDAESGRAELAAGLAIARELAWLNFFRAVPVAAATLCALALEHGIEAAFVHDVIAERGLAAPRPDLAAWPWPVRVHTFGGLRVDVRGQPLVFKGKVAKKPLELLLFVVAAGGHDVALARAADALWRELDGDKARAALNVALHRLRKLLGHDDALKLEHGRLGLNAQRVWVDALAFEQLADPALAPGAGSSAPAERALALYRAPFAGGDGGEPWQALFASRLASRFQRLVMIAARAAVARGDGAAARAWLERGLEADPQAEDLAIALRGLPDAGSVIDP